MPTDQAGPRNTLLAVALVGVVAACGAAGMFFSKEVSHAATITPIAPPVSDSHATRPDPLVLEETSREHPVQPEAAPATPPALAETPSVVADASAAPPVSAGTSPDQTPGQITDDKEVSLALRRWQKAMLTNDSAEIAPSYAPHVDRFFLRTQVDRAFVRDYLERDEETGKRLTRYDMEGVSMKHLKGDEVQVDFHANFAVSTPEKDRTGNAKTSLILKRLEGDWKIVYERDFSS